MHHDSNAVEQCSEKRGTFKRSVDLEVRAEPTRLRHSDRRPEERLVMEFQALELGKEG